MHKRTRPEYKENIKKMQKRIRQEYKENINSMKNKNNNKQGLSRRREVHKTQRLPEASFIRMLKLMARIQNLHMNSPPTF